MKIIGHLLRDITKELLWLHTFTCDTDFTVNTNFGTLDLATCEQIDAEIVSAHYFFISACSAELLIAKDKKGNFAALTIFEDSMGYGNVHASITPGFTFKSIHGFADIYEFYIIGENLEGKWGIFRISDNNSQWWGKGRFIPNAIVDFRFENMQDTLNYCQIAKDAANDGRLIDFTAPTDIIATSISHGELEWGRTLQNIRLEKFGNDV